MTFEASITYFFVILIFGITPGPGVFALLARVLTVDAKSCFALALGMALCDIIYLIMACLGLAALAYNFQEVFTAVRFLGAAYLFYLAWKMWVAPVNMDASSKMHINKDVSWRARFAQGALISASNPKVILFYLAFLPTFIDMQELGVPDIALLSALTLCALMLGLMVLVYGVNRSKQAFRSTRSLRNINRVAGCAMAGAGVYLVSR